MLSFFFSKIKHSFSLTKFTFVQTSFDAINKRLTWTSHLGFKKILQIPIYTSLNAICVLYYFGGHLILLFFIFENLFLQQLSARAKGALYWNVSVPVVFFINVAEISSVAHILLIKSFQLFPSF